jgi:hypothetical protein
MVLGIDFNKVYRDEILGSARKIQTLLKEENIEVKLGDLLIADIKDPKHTILLNNSADDYTEGYMQSKAIMKQD